MSVHITRRALIGSASAAAALWLTGCATTAAPREENIRPATFSNLGARAARHASHRQAHSHARGRCLQGRRHLLLRR